MKQVSGMTLGELAAHIDTHLKSRGIEVVLSGGATVAIYSHHKYVSKDLDFIGRFSLDHKKLAEVMAEIGFELQGKGYFHPETEYFVEFISGPPTVGPYPMGEISELEFDTGVVRIISPTDSVKDRLAAYYYWNDLQGLEQAVLVAKSNPIDMTNVESWSIREGKAQEFEAFRRRLQS